MSRNAGLYSSPTRGLVGREHAAKPRSRSIAPERAAGGMALLVVDMISCWDFQDAQKLLPEAAAIAPAIAAFSDRCRRAGVPVIYANDNLGRWRSDFNALVAWSLECGGEAADITAAIRPQDDDYFVLKPKHSAFHATPLSLLLAHLQVRTVCMAGVASDQCIMTSVAEARMRDLDVVVPSDLVASQTAERNAAALLQFKNVYKLRTPRSPGLRLPSS